MRMTYCNPVYPGYMADPAVIRSRGAYWAYGTGGPGDPRSAGRALPILRSRDLVQWEAVGGALVPPAALTGAYFWAPDVVEKGGAYYLYYSAGAADGWGHQIRVAVAARPEGPFVDQDIILMPEEPFSIDPHVFQDPLDGRWYMFFAKDFFDGRAGTGTAVVALSEDLLATAGPVHTVVRAMADWQIYQRHRHWYGRTWEAWHTVEGPFALAHEGRYYCLYSGGRWETPEYGVGAAVADSITGPYHDEHDAGGPIVLRGVPGRVIGPGHNSVILGPDGVTPFVVYHAWDAAGLVRHLCIDPLLWTLQGPRCAGPTCEPQELELPLAVPVAAGS